MSAKPAEWQDEAYCSYPPPERAPALSVKLWTSLLGAASTVAGARPPDVKR